MTLLTLSFTSLSWKDTTNCHRTASMVCWALLQQVEASPLITIQEKMFDLLNDYCVYDKQPLD